MWRLTEVQRTQHPPLLTTGFCLLSLEHYRFSRLNTKRLGGRYSIHIFSDLLVKGFKMTRHVHDRKRILRMRMGLEDGLGQYPTDQGSQSQILQRRKR